MIVGHGTARVLLADALFPATLIEGVAGIGKRLVALEAATHHGDEVFAPEGSLTTAQADAAVSFVRGDHDGVRIAVLDLDGSQEVAQHRLLKTLELPPPRTALILVSDGSRCESIASRCFRIRCFPLTVDETFRVLLARGAPPTDAHRIAQRCEGRPDLGMAYKAALSERGRVLGVLKAVSARNWSLVGRTLNVPWSEHSVMALRLWLNEALTGEHFFFGPLETFGLERSVPMPVLLQAERRLEMSAPPGLVVSLVARTLLGR